MSMFCQMRGNKHFTRDVAPITHYLRHQCDNGLCGYYGIFELCTPCAEEFSSYARDSRYNYNTTRCPKCNRKSFARVVFTVYENKAQ